MISAFFEGPAGSGKTYQLIEHAQAAYGELLADQKSKLLALTFMNGARHRLNAKFRSVPYLRGRFLCLTVDAFAGMVAHRRRTLLGCLPEEPQAADVSDFDRTCIEAARLLEVEAVAKWVSASYPLIVVDEAQDLDPHRFRILKALARSSCVIAAADEFQTLNENLDTSEVMRWLRSAGAVTSLSIIKRTSHEGLLCVAGALRNAKTVTAELTSKDGFIRSHEGAGIRIIEPPAKHVGTLAWAVACELSRMDEHTVILTPDARGERIRDVLKRVETSIFNRNKSARTTFGPFPLSWERRDDEEAASLVEAIPGGTVLSLVEAIETIARFNSPERHHICRRLEKARNLRGETVIGRDRLRELVEDVFRDAGRAGWHPSAGRRVMTIQRAKNREFGHVLVLWPHSARGDADHQRRLLYNAVTRARDHCSIVVFGKDRMAKAPFYQD